MKHTYSTIAPDQMAQKIKNRCAIIIPFYEKCMTSSNVPHLKEIEEEAKFVQSKKLTIHLHTTNKMHAIVWFDDVTHDANYYKNSMRQVVQVLEDHGCDTCIMDLRSLSCRNLAWRIEYAIHVMEESTHEVVMKTNPKESSSVHCLFVVDEEIDQTIQERIKLATCVETGKKTLTHLCNFPSNIVTPTYIAEYAKNLQEKYKELEVNVLDENHPEMKKMGALLSVAQGSQQPPRLVVVKRMVTNDPKPIVLVGKGVTFDTGGISIKPSMHMESMKFDMTGAATALATIETACQLRINKSIVAVLPLVENMPGGRASRPGDIVVSYSKKTIEIRNTDAEGRLILADALSYSAKHLNPRIMISVATLTGAIIVALSDIHTGLFSNSETLAAQIMQAGKDSSDLLWQLPMGDAYHKFIDTPVADVCNISTSGKGAGSITAACFLERFVPKEIAWAHLDIAGTATKMHKNGEFATGRPLHW